MPGKKAKDGLNELADTVVERIERVTNEGLGVVQKNAEALAKAAEAQYKTGLDLLKKSTDAAQGLLEGEFGTRAGDLVDAAVDSARQSADHWLEFAQSSLGSVRKLVETALQGRKAA